MGSASSFLKLAQIKSVLARESFANSPYGHRSYISTTPLMYLVLAATLFASVTSCSSRVGSKDSLKNSSSKVAIASEELARRSLFSPSQTGSESGFAVDLVEREDSSEIEIAMAVENGSKPEVSTLQSPPRIVIDIAGVAGTKSSSIETPESLYISRVRLGAHPHKSRIVLDMNEGSQIVPFLQDMGNGSYKIQLSQSGASSDTIVASASSAAIQNEPAVVPELVKPSSSVAALEETSKQQLALQKESAHKFSEPLDEVMASPALENENLKSAASPQMPAELTSPKTESATAKSSKANSKPTVFSYELQSVSPSENTLLIHGEGLANYSMKRSAPSEYVLRIPGAALADGAQESLIAPQGSGAIRSVRAKAAGDVLEVRIFTAPQDNLEVKGSKTNLVVAASTGFDLSSSLAQAKPGLASDAAVDSAFGSKSSPVDSEVSSLLGDKPRYTGRLISLDLQDTDIDNALRIIAEVSNLNIIASEEVSGKITLRLIDVPWDQALDVILKTNGLDSVQENNVVRIAPVDKLRAEREALKQSRQAEEELEPLGVKYVRISYAKVAELKPLVESVLSERGIVAYDDRTNQLIIKDVRKGIVNVAELIAKLDLRTPQVLLETQIVEATKSLSRELGAEFGFNFIQSPATGNATGNNFPNAILIGGSGRDGNASSFGTLGNDSAVTFLLESADGTKSLSARLSALEREGRVKIVSRPAVATTNNKQATIKSVTKVRVKQPSGGTSVATGQGAQASGSGSATETFEAGIVLEVTPQASPDYYVLLDINAKSSTLSAETTDGIPNEIERSATSSVLVSSGQTFAMGGIYQTAESDSVEGVPFFKDIPVLGHLFRRTTTNQRDEELLFFITPRIIEGSFDDAAMKTT